MSAPSVPLDLCSAMYVGFAEERVVDGRIYLCTRLSLISDHQVMQHARTDSAGETQPLTLRSRDSTDSEDSLRALEVSDGPQAFPDQASFAHRFMSRFLPCCLSLNWTLGVDHTLFLDMNLKYCHSQPQFRVQESLAMRCRRRTLVCPKVRNSRINTSASVKQYTAIGTV